MRGADGRHSLNEVHPARRVSCARLRLMYFTSLSIYELSLILLHMEATLITSFQMRAARALLGIDQRTLAELAGVSLPTIQRMEASDGTVRGVVETLTRVVEALDRAGVDADRRERAQRGAAGAACASKTRAAAHAPAGPFVMARSSARGDATGACGHEQHAKADRASAAPVAQPTLPSCSRRSSSPCFAKAMALADLRADVIAGLTSPSSRCRCRWRSRSPRASRRIAGSTPPIDRRLPGLAARRQPLSDRRAGRRVHRAGGADGRAPRRRRRDARDDDGGRDPDRRRPAAARHLHQVHSLSGDGRIHGRHRRHHLRQPDQGPARPHAAAGARRRSFTS